MEGYVSYACYLSVFGCLGTFDFRNRQSLCAEFRLSPGTSLKPNTVSHAFRIPYDGPSFTFFSLLFGYRDHKWPRMSTGSHFLLTIPPFFPPREFSLKEVCTRCAGMSSSNPPFLSRSPCLSRPDSLSPPPVFPPSKVVVFGWMRSLSALFPLASPPPLSAGCLYVTPLKIFTGHRSSSLHFLFCLLLSKFSEDPV